MLQALIFQNIPVSYLYWNWLSKNSEMHCLLKMFNCLSITPLPVIQRSCLFSSLGAILLLFPSINTCAKPIWKIIPIAIRHLWHLLQLHLCLLLEITCFYLFYTEIASYYCIQILTYAWIKIQVSKIPKKIYLSP